VVGFLKPSLDFFNSSFNVILGNWVLLVMELNGINDSSWNLQVERMWLIDLNQALFHINSSFISFLGKWGAWSLGV